MAGVKEYWIVNLRDQKSELHLEPLPTDGIYANVSHHGAGATFRSPFAGEVVVGELLVAGEATEEE